MSNSFYLDFSDKVKSTRLSDCVNKYYACQRNYKYFVFVEGKLDEIFYSYFLHKKIKPLFIGDIKYLSCGNKNNIGNLINFLIIKHGKLFPNHYFIADRDYNGLNDIDCLRKDKISLTKYYSLESYAFLNENLNLILEFCELNDSDKELFYKLLEDALKEIIDYEVLVDMRTNNQIDLSTDILSLDVDSIAIYNNKLIFNALFRNKINLTISSIKKNDNLLSIFLKKREEKEMNHLFIRGHDLEFLFDLFMNYLNINIELNNLLKSKKLVERMNIDLNLK